MSRSPGSGRIRAAALAAARVSALASAVIVATAVPTAAIETQQFGVEPYPLFEGTEVRRSFDLALEPGGSATEAVRLWNKTKRPVEVRLYGAGVHVEDGRYEVAAFEARTGGAGDWVVPEREAVRLGPGEEEVVEFTIHVPPVLGGDARTAALVAESDTGISSAGVDVVARLAMLVQVRQEQGIIGGLSWWIVLAILLILVATVAAVRARRRARRPPAPSTIRDEVAVGA